MFCGPIEDPIVDGEDFLLTIVAPFDQLFRALVGEEVVGCDLELLEGSSTMSMDVSAVKKSREVSSERCQWHSRGTLPGSFGSSLMISS